MLLIYEHQLTGRPLSGPTCQKVPLTRSSYAFTVSSTHHTHPLTHHSHPLTHSPYSHTHTHSPTISIHTHTHLPHSLTVVALIALSTEEVVLNAHSLPNSILLWYTFTDLLDLWGKYSGTSLQGISGTLKILHYIRNSL